MGEMAVELSGAVVASDDMVVETKNIDNNANNNNANSAALSRSNSASIPVEAFDADGVLDLRPTYRQAIQDEVHRMKGMDYSNTHVQRDVWLPPEVMINIMLSPSRTTVAIMTRVCKVREQWNSSSPLN